MKVSELAESVFNEVYAPVFMRNLSKVPKSIRQQLLKSYCDVFKAGYGEAFEKFSSEEGTCWGFENDFHR